MFRILHNLRVKVLVLFILVGLTIHFGWQLEAATACEKCVFPTGGLCVACSQYGNVGETGYNSCIPDQATCSCTVSGGTCGLIRFENPCENPAGCGGN
jgi:hypothetical protein